MHPPDADVVLVRYGETSVKSASVQADFAALLETNLAAALDARGVNGRVEHAWTRPRVYTDESDVEAATDVAADTFGVASASPARELPPDLDAICSALAETAERVFAGETFAVDARRVGPSDAHPFGTRDLLVEGGDAVGDVLPDATVDLDDPDVTFSVECREDEAFVFCEKREGPGGLPLGCQAPLVALVSGGIDSPVAAYETMRRGSPAIPVYADLGPYGGADHRARAMETLRTLVRYAPTEDLRPYVLELGDLATDLVETMEAGRMLAFHRALYAAAERVAEREEAVGVVTGEAIGQKSSQTTRNLAVTSQATTLPVHRPLLTWDKHDIEARARAIGTFDDSTIPAGCTRIAPDQAETNASIEVQHEVEPDDLLARARAVGESADRVDESGW